MDSRKVRRIAGLAGGLASALIEGVTHVYLIASAKPNHFKDLHFLDWSDVVIQALLTLIVVDVAVHLLIFDFFYAEAFEAIRDLLSREPAETIRSVLDGFSKLEKALPTLETISHHFPSETSAQTMRELRDGLSRLRNNLPIAVFRVDRNEDYFQKRLTTLTKEIQSSLEDLSEGHYEELLNNEISDISINIYGDLRKGAFCTALQEHLNIFSELARSRELVAANDAAAERLYNTFSQRMITRLFIFDNMSAIPKHLALLRRQHEKHVDVKVMLREAVRSANIPEDNLDFGIWDGELVMKITGSKGSPKLVVSKRERELTRAEDLKSALSAEAMDWQSFNEHLREPMNRNWGQFADPNLMLFLPPPNGPGAKDVGVMFKEAKKAIPENDGRIGILGLTGPLINAAELLRQTYNGLKIEVVDIRCDPGASNGTEFTNDNWLNWHPKNQFDVVFGDDILCNLRPWQFPLLFEGLNRALKEDGHFIVRTTVRSDTIGSLDERAMLDLLRDRGSKLETLWAVPDSSSEAWRSERETAAYEIAWPFLHHDSFYNSKVPSGFDLGEWNRWIQGEVKGGRLDRNLGRHLSLKYGVQITSAEPDYLRGQAKHHGFNAYEKDVQSIWADDDRYRAIDPLGEIATRFKDHYKIYVFKKVSQPK